MSKKSVKKKCTTSTSLEEQGTLTSALTDGVKDGLKSENEQWLNKELSNLNPGGGKTTQEWSCPYCKVGDPHLLVLLNKNGDIHVHAPFENKYLMNQFIEAIMTEQKKFNKYKGQEAINDQWESNWERNRR